ncbi:MAG: hypothetical protein JRI55_14265, partial [Deltaproteobacteria bacterium]|nr:hypothetical protein [Deltaproteobacteria bacterium]
MPKDPLLLHRREFVRASAALCGATLAGCAGPATTTRKDPAPTGPPTRYQPPSEARFPLLEVGGGPYAMGHAIGKRFADEIRGGFEARGKWWRELKA